MKNYVQGGETLPLVAPYAVAGGDGLLVGSIFAVATFAAASGAVVEAQTEGVYDLIALGTDVATQGAKAYWDNTNKRVTTTVGSNSLIGAFVVAKAGGDTSARIALNGTTV